ncbi:hypothetical protein NA56DRAFT_707041 [Hyaloscypha hepaticicola]|uniref:Uncharacterized protein n=1 Tax=Hyaloscypha hepaticicola TaxID=2082293 RepID=A0A2J6PVF3_9HELO|nr:hypothetical protein NA56DRAFT_707041 [Hyaloscypha hepaticicola]
MPRKLPRWLTLRALHDKSEHIGGLFRRELRTAYYCENGAERLETRSASMSGNRPLPSAPSPALICVDQTKNETPQENCFRRFYADAEAQKDKMEELRAEVMPADDLHTTCIADWGLHGTLGSGKEEAEMVPAAVPTIRFLLSCCWFAFAPEDVDISAIASGGAVEQWSSEAVKQ